MYKEINTELITLYCTYFATMKSSREQHSPRNFLFYFKKQLLMQPRHCVYLNISLAPMTNLVKKKYEIGAYSLTSLKILLMIWKMKTFHWKFIHMCWKISLNFESAALDGINSELGWHFHPSAQLPTNERRRLGTEK